MKSTLYSKIGFWLYPCLLPLIRFAIRRTNRVYVVLQYKGEVVLIKNWLARPTWRLPGGGVGKGETPEQAVVREVKEELRIVLVETRLTHLNRGVMRSDRLGFAYDVFLYNLSTYPKILPDRMEIVDCMLADSIPPDTLSDHRVILEGVIGIK